MDKQPQPPDQPRPLVSPQPFDNAGVVAPVPETPPPEAQPPSPTLNQAIQAAYAPAAAFSKRSSRLIALAGVLMLVILIVIVNMLVANISSSRQNHQAGKAAGAAPVAGNSAQQNRNAERRSDILALQIQLEAFFTQNSYYPSLSDMNSLSWRAAYMKSLNPAALVDPLSPCDPATTDCLLTAPASQAYAYVVKDSQGNDCENDDTRCSRYTLTATYEDTYKGAHTFTRNSLE